MLRTGLTALLLVLAAACAQLPRAEFQAYREAFQAAQTAAAPINADYAVTERAARLMVLQKAPARDSDGRVLLDDNRNPIPRQTRADPYFQTFDVADASAVSTIGLPPGAAAVDRAYRALASYNETLIALAENRNVDEARAQLRQIVNDVGAIGQVDSGTLAIAGAVTDLVTNIFRPAIEAGNRELFKQKVLEGYPAMIALIDLLRAHSESQYRAIISPMLNRLELGQGIRDELIAKINAWHRVFGDYVVLLDALKARLADLRDAVLHPRDVSVLARASAGAAQLRGYAEGLRSSITALRALP